MKWAALLLSLLPDSCVPTLVPTAAQVRTVEHRLKSQRCIGDLANWYRMYWIDPEQTEILQFSLGKPITKWSRGIRTFPTHRWKKIVHYNDAPWVAAGMYNLKSGNLTVNFCGSNRS